jgi:molecular chaperone DnaK (HSP70)
MENNMSTDVIFYTQIASIIAFLVALFVPYKVLVAQKDALIELLKQEIEAMKRKLSDTETQSPDVLVTALSSRVEIAKAEIQRLKQDGDAHQVEIREKEKQLRRLEEKLTVLNELIKDSELVCPKCKSPLVTRGSHTIYGYIDGREVDADIEYLEYECGFSTDGAEEKSTCRSSVGKL